MTLPIKLNTQPWWAPETRVARVGAAYPAFGLLVVVLVVVALIPGLLGPSLDAAVFSLAGSRISTGGLPYVDVFDHKPPGIYFINALGDVLGGGIGSWATSWIISVAAITLTAVVVAGMLRQMGFRRSAWIAAAILAVELASFPLALGGGLTESVAVLPAAIAFRLVAVGPTRLSRRFVAGLMAGLATAISLQAAPLLLAVLVAGILRREDVDGRRRSPFGAIAWVGVGAALAWTAFLFVLGTTGALPAAVAGLVSYNAAFTALASLDDPIGGQALHALLVLSPLVVAALVGTGSMLLHPSTAPVAWAALAWIASGVALIVVQGRMELHYVALLALPLAVLAAAGLRLRPSVGLPPLRLGMVAGALLVSSVLSVVLIGGETSMAVSSRISQADRTDAVAAWVRSHTAADDAIFVWGNAPDLYLAAERAPSSGYVYMLPLTTPGYVDEAILGEVLAGWIAAPPTVIVDAGSPAPGLPGLPALLVPRPVAAIDGRSADLLDPLREFVRANYFQADTINGWPVYLLR